MTNTAKPKGSLAPMNQLVLMRAYPTASFHDVVRPNAYVVRFRVDGPRQRADDFESTGHAQPVCPLSGVEQLDERIHITGDAHDRNQSANLRIHGAELVGHATAGVKQVASASRFVWMIGRIYCTGTPEDYAAVHKIENAIKLVPLSSYDKAYTPPVAGVDPSIAKAPPKQVNAMDGKSFFTLFARLLKDSPPLPDDTAMVATLKRLGITPPGHFDYAKLDSATKAAIDAAPASGQAEIKAFTQKAGKSQGVLVADDVQAAVLFLRQFAQ